MGEALIVRKGGGENPLECLNHSPFVYFHTSESVQVDTGKVGTTYTLSNSLKWVQSNSFYSDNGLRPDIGLFYVNGIQKSFTRTSGSNITLRKGAVFVEYGKDTEIEIDAEFNKKAVRWRLVSRFVNSGSTWKVEIDITPLATDEIAEGYSFGTSLYIAQGVFTMAEE